MSDYHLFEHVVVRLAGVPFRHVGELETPRAIVAARDVMLAEDALGGPHKRFEKRFDPKRLADVDAALNQALTDEVQEGRRRLLRSARDVLPHHLVLTGKLELVPEHAEVEGERRTKDRTLEQTLLLCLQRVCTKNDTFSAFGPVCWGSVRDDVRGLRIEPKPGIANRIAQIETWVLRVVSQLMNADPEARLEMAPSLSRVGRVEGLAFIDERHGTERALTAFEAAVLARCDGQQPAYRFGDALPTLEQLAASGLVDWGASPPIVEPERLGAMRAWVNGWRDGAAKERWAAVLAQFAALADAFVKDTAVESRAAVLRETSALITRLGGSLPEQTRMLYAATNPIIENCARDIQFHLGTDVASRLVTDAAPWFDLWRDCWGYLAQRVSDQLRPLLASAARRDGRVGLPAFMAECEKHGLSLMGKGPMERAAEAFGDIRRAFAEMMGPRASAPEVVLSESGCRFVRERFSFTAFDELTWPSADLQISATTPEAVAAGDYDLLIAELHAPSCFIGQCLFWCLPDVEPVKRAWATITSGQPVLCFNDPAGGVCHTTPHLDDLGRQWAYLGYPAARSPLSARPADLDVYETNSGDVRVRLRDGRDVGSLVRTLTLPWVGMHPFVFPLEGHTPRLRVGRTIVQRRTWSVAEDELFGGPYSGVSPRLLVAVERLRAAKGWPRWVYVRPSDRALHRMSVMGRDKDVKPVFIDLESYFFVEIFYRWLKKHGELDVSEMLPAPDRLAWPEADGPRTYEIRTLIGPFTGRSL